MVGNQAPPTPSCLFLSSSSIFSFRDISRPDTDMSARRANSRASALRKPATMYGHGSGYDRMCGLRLQALVVPVLPSDCSVEHNHLIFPASVEHLAQLMSLSKGFHRPHSLRNSSRVFALLRMQPSIQLVTVKELVFWTPRMTMHRWLDSMTTATPRGWRTSESARATCLVSRSCT